MADTPSVDNKSDRPTLKEIFIATAGTLLVLGLLAGTQILKVKRRAAKMQEYEQAADREILKSLARNTPPQQYGAVQDQYLLGGRYHVVVAFDKAGQLCATATRYQDASGEPLTPAVKSYCAPREPGVK